MVEEDTIVVVRTFVLRLSCRILGMARVAVGMRNGIKEIILEIRLKGMVDGSTTRGESQKYFATCRCGTMSDSQKNFGKENCVRFHHGTVTLSERRTAAKLKTLTTTRNIVVPLSPLFDLSELQASRVLWLNLDVNVEH